MKNFKIFFMITTVAGVLFSGYMSSVKLFSNVCAFGETCPYIFGMPACYIGFVLFLSLLITSKLLVFTKIQTRKISKALLIISAAGVLYSLYFAIPELPLLFQNGFKAYMLGLPTCVLGSLFFIAIFTGSVIFYKKTKSQ
jgi:uncharacterized membrane protein